MAFINPDWVNVICIGRRARLVKLPVFSFMHPTSFVVAELRLYLHGHWNGHWMNQRGIVCLLSSDTGSEGSLVDWPSQDFAIASRPSGGPIP